MLHPDEITPDAEHVDQLLRMPGYEIVAKRLREEISRRIRALIDAGTDVDRTRGMIQGLELALKVPQIIADESRGGKKK